MGAKKWNNPVSKIRLLPVDEDVFTAINRWCGWHSKTPSEAIKTLFDVEDSTKRDDLMRAYYYILGKKYQIDTKLKAKHE